MLHEIPYDAVRNRIECDNLQAGVPDNDDDAGTPESIDDPAYLLGCLNDIVKGKIESMGVVWNHETRMMYVADTPENRAALEAFFASINGAYEGDEQYAGVWENLDLGGDDDVDYNSSMPHMAISAAWEIIDAKGK